jgi:hypothetical protein
MWRSLSFSTGTFRERPMMPGNPAVRHVVERCPSCGVEHDVSVDSICEACDTPLRAWCRAHSRETGWLDEPACDRCAKEDAPRPAAAPPAAPIRAAAVPAVVRPAPAPESRFLPPRPGRPLREVLGDRDAVSGRRRGRGPGGKVKRGLGVVAVVFLLVIGAAGLFVSLIGMQALFTTDGPGPASRLMVLALACFFLGSLMALAVAVDAMRKGRGGPDDLVKE